MLCVLTPRTPRLRQPNSKQRDRANVPQVREKQPTGVQNKDKIPDVGAAVLSVGLSHA